MKTPDTIYLIDTGNEITWCGKQFPSDGIHKGDTCAYTKLSISRAVHDELRRRLNIAANNHCSCGGKGPKDKGVCPACLVWHELK